MKRFKMEKKCKGRDLIWHMASEMVRIVSSVLSVIVLVIVFNSFISQVKEPSHFSMLETKLWHNKTEIKNVKVAKMMEFIKTCDQYPRRFNFCNLFNSIILPPVLLEKKKMLRQRCLGGMCNFHLFGRRWEVGSKQKSMKEIYLGAWVNIDI